MASTSEVRRIQGRLKEKQGELEALAGKGDITEEEEKKLEGLQKDILDLQAMEMDFLPELEWSRDEPGAVVQQAKDLGKEIQRREVGLLTQLNKRDALFWLFFGGATLLVLNFAFWWIVDPFVWGQVHFGRFIAIASTVAVVLALIFAPGKISEWFSFVVGDEIPPRAAILTRLGSVRGAADSGLFLRLPEPIDKLAKFKTSQITVRYERMEVISKASEDTLGPNGNSRPGRESEQKMPVEVTFIFRWPSPNNLYFMPLSGKYVWGSDLLNRARRSLPGNPEDIDHEFMHNHLEASVMEAVQNTMAQYTHSYNRNNRRVIEREVKLYLVDQAGNVVRNLGIPPILMDLALRYIGLPDDTQRAFERTEIERLTGEQTVIRAQAEADANVRRAEGEKKAAPDRRAAVEEMLQAYISPDSSRDLANMIVGGATSGGGEGRQGQGFSIEPLVQIMVLRALGEMSAGQSKQSGPEGRPFTTDDLLGALDKMTPAQRRVFESRLRRERRNRG